MTSSPQPFEGHRRKSYQSQKAVQKAMTGTAACCPHPAVYPWTLHPLIRVGSMWARIQSRHSRKLSASTSCRHRTRGPLPGRSKPRGPKQLERIESLNGARASNGRFLDQNLRHLPGLGFRPIPREQSRFMSFVVHHAQRDALLWCPKTGVDTTIGYMSNARIRPCLNEATSCPNAERAFDELLHIQFINLSVSTESTWWRPFTVLVWH